MSDTDYTHQTHLKGCSTLTWVLRRQIRYSLSSIRTITSHRTSNVKSILKLALILCRISVRMRDGFELPIVMAYDKSSFDEKSPWIMFTKGSISQKSDLQFDNHMISIMSRGMCCCYPLLRGNQLIAEDYRHQIL